MPIASSYPDVVHDLEALLTATEEHAASLPTVEPHRVALSNQLDEIKSIKARQDSAQATRQQSTQDLKAAVIRGRELGIRLRGAVKADVGPKSELLVRFGIAPIRRRVRRAKPVEPPVDKGVTPAGS